MHVKDTQPRHSGLRIRTGLLLFALVLLLGAAPSLAQTGTGDIEIQVTDLKGKGLADVKVTVSQESSGFSAVGATSKKGKFTLKIPKANGKYAFTFEKEGLATHTVEYPIAAGKSSTSVKLVDQATKNKAMAVESFNEAVGLIQNGKEDEALAGFQKARELDPNLADAHRLVAIIQAGKGNIDDAEAALNTFLQMNPEGLQSAAPAAYDVFRARGDSRLGEVRGMLQQLGIATDYSIKVFNEGVAATKAKDKAKAMELFTEAATLNPKLSNAYQSMAALEFNDEKYAAALPFLEKLIELDPQNVEGQRLSFFSYMNTGDAGAAKKAAAAWGAIAPNAADQILVQAKLKFDADQTDDAQSLLEMILDINADHPGGNLTMGMLHARSGRAADAKKFLQRFLELAPDHPEAASAREMIAGL